jgi:hypothetical protein
MVRLRQSFCPYNWFKKEHVLDNRSSIVSQKLLTKVKANMIHQIEKSQIPSTKLQTNLYCFQGAGRKFQYSITKTDLSLRSSSLEFGILVIVICLLFGIWNLVLSVFGSRTILEIIQVISETPQCHGSMDTSHIGW